MNSVKKLQDIKVAVDAVVFGYFDKKDLQILLIKRNIEPFKGGWSIPGELVLDDENLDDAVKRELIHDLDKFEFEILQHRMNLSHQSYDIFYKSSENENVLKDFIFSFKEKFCYKESYTLYLYNNKEINDILDIYSKNDQQHIKLAESLITYIDNVDENIIYYPYKDFKYHEIIKNK
ncbi:NUDIX domain-containing protein [Chryseobacterium aquaeductus]|nr:NUDIX domain-containing protein [Chryseobacterium aquaeductus]